jgi:protein-L-isoaspartate(D-aspartate) O-methyltransferase
VQIFAPALFRRLHDRVANFSGSAPDLKRRRINSGVNSEYAVARARIVRVASARCFPSGFWSKAMSSSQGKMPSSSRPTRAFADQRCFMVENQIAARGVSSELLLDAMREVPREAFVPEDLRSFAYEDTPLPIGDGQTISQPYIVAFMVEALMLEGGESVLEIGTGSGYAAAVLARIAREVYTVERIGTMAKKAARRLARLGYEHVHVKHGDGTRGWPEHAPYDAIVVAAGGPDVPDSLKSQLKIGGRLVMPVGSDPHMQDLVRVTRLEDGDYRMETIADVRFVPLVGDYGWAKDEKPMRRRIRFPARKRPRH